MITISLRTDFERFARKLDRISKEQLPFAARQALDDAAKEAQNRIIAELPSIFDRPTPFTLRAIARIPAAVVARDYGNDVLAAAVYVRPIQAKYLLPEELGGVRTPESNTRKMARALVMPGARLPLDAHGNIPTGTLAKLLREAKAHPKAKAALARRGKKIEAASAAGDRRARHTLISADRDGSIAYIPADKVRGPFDRIGGYFMRLANGKLARLTGFQAETHYKPRFGFQQRVGAAAAEVFSRSLVTRLREALRTAR